MGIYGVLQPGENFKNREKYMAKIADKLDNINRTLEKILAVMDKRNRPIINILIIGGLIAAFLGIINPVDTIIKWLKEYIWLVQ